MGSKMKKLVLLSILTLASVLASVLADVLDDALEFGRQRWEADVKAAVLSSTSADRTALAKRSAKASILESATAYLLKQQRSKRHHHQPLAYFTHSAFPWEPDTLQQRINALFQEAWQRQMALTRNPIPSAPRPAFQLRPRPAFASSGSSTNGSIGFGPSQTAPDSAPSSGRAADGLPILTNQEVPVEPPSEPEEADSDLPPSPPPDSFAENIPCEEKTALESDSCASGSSYRSFSGVCNNLGTGSSSSPALTFGRHSTPFERLLPHHYDDGVSGLRSRARDGHVLPSAREVSNAIHASLANVDSLDTSHTLSLMQWGQYLDHDITLTPMVSGPEGRILDCDGCDAADKNVACHPIPVPADDPFYPFQDPQSGQRKCIPFTRSLPAQDSLGVRRHLNRNTAWLDASSVYGSDPCRVQDLRMALAPQLNMTMSSSAFVKPLLPKTVHFAECRSPGGECFHAGDERSSEQPALVSMHTIFLRQHNRLVAQLSAINPHWPMDKTFQEARKIVIALHQHITYNEFLPRILGPRLMGLYQLSLSHTGYFNGYNESCSPNIFDEFATAAFRFGHTLIRSSLTLMTPSREVKSEIRLRHHLNNPDVLSRTRGIVDDLILGLSSKPMARYDAKVSEELTNHLFEEVGKPFSGQDLVSLNIQRGRDHGIPGYSQYLKLCAHQIGTISFAANLTAPIETFAQLGPILGAKMSRRLARVYRHVDDIDLFPGGLAEPSLPDGLVGPTFGCIIGSQFRNLRRCDRFWYETPDTRIGFTPTQLQQIKKVTLAVILCKNSDHNMPVQRMIFDLPDKSSNPLTDCDQLPDLDIRHWKDKTGTRSILSGRGLNDDFCDVKGWIIPLEQSMRISACQQCTCLRKDGTSEAQCRTVRFDTCDTLINEVGQDAAQTDPECHNQCPHLFP